MIVIKPFDPASIKEIEKAIKSSDLSIAPIVESKLIRLNIPPLSEERRRQIAQQVKQLGEEAKVIIRNIRRDANKELEKRKKAGSSPKTTSKKANTRLTMYQRLHRKNRFHC